MKNITIHAKQPGNTTVSRTASQYRFQPSDMVGSYRWPVSFQNVAGWTEDPENLVLNRSDGFDMMAFINECADRWNWGEDDLVSCIKLERIVLFKVPDECMTRNQVRRWVEKNFSVSDLLS